MTATRTIADAMVDPRAAYDRLAALGEEIDDEWTYVNDLAESWRAALDAVVAARGTEPVGERVDAALERAAEEIDRITDPHRAIDWLSTYPQLVLLALGARP